MYGLRVLGPNRKYMAAALAQNRVLESFAKFRKFRKVYLFVPTDIDQLLPVLQCHRLWLEIACSL